MCGSRSCGMPAVLVMAPAGAGAGSAQEAPVEKRIEVAGVMAIVPGGRTLGSITLDDGRCFDLAAGNGVEAGATLAEQARGGERGVDVLAAGVGCRVDVDRHQGPEGLGGWVRGQEVVDPEAPHLAMNIIYRMRCCTRRKALCRNGFSLRCAWHCAH